MDPGKGQGQGEGGKAGKLSRGAFGGPVGLGFLLLVRVITYLVACTVVASSRLFEGKPRQTTDSRLDFCKLRLDRIGRFDLTSILARRRDEAAQEHHS